MIMLFLMGFIFPSCSPCYVQSMDCLFSVKLIKLLRKYAFLVYLRYTICLFVCMNFVILMHTSWFMSLLYIVYSLRVNNYKYNECCEMLGEYGLGLALLTCWVGDSFPVFWVWKFDKKRLIFCFISRFSWHYLLSFLFVFHFFNEVFELAIEHARITFRLFF